MTLSVNVYLRHSDGTFTDLIEIGSPESLAGPEAFRFSLYGSAEMRSLGTRLLPELARSDLWVEGSELDELKAEVTTALTHFGAYGGETSFSNRLTNILNAINLAQENGGGVHIG